MTKTTKTLLGYVMMGALWALPVAAQEVELPPMPAMPAVEDASLPPAPSVLPDDPADALAAQLDAMEDLPPAEVSSAPAEEAPAPAETATETIAPESIPSLPPLADEPAPAAVVSNTDALPPIPDAPANDMFDPTNPFAAPPPTDLSPIKPQATPDNSAQSAATLPLPGDQETFDFFQSGRQIRDDLNDPNKQLSVVKPVEVEPVKEVRRAPPKPRFQRTFNYRNQHLPEAIYKKKYNNENRHLPVARWESDYDALTFNAAARNDLNGLRALVGAGRNLFMVNAQGETLAMVATRHRAHDTLRYLLAKGVSPSAPNHDGVSPLHISEQQRDARAQAALRTAGAF